MPGRRPGPPGGPSVGEPGRLPAWWPNRHPPVPLHFLRRNVGTRDFFYVAIYGNTGTARDPNHTAIYKQRVDEIEEYQDGAPGGMTGGVAFGYSCVWRRVNVAGMPEPKPVARRTWATLAPSTKSSYRGTMRHRLGLKTEEQFAEYYETAPDLSTLRRHYEGHTTVVKGFGRISFPRGGDSDPWTWLATWQRS